ncbi:DUF4961 domain-containing protein [Spongiimicrobium sp. 3-5]|uniref:DUF4961 domain-containing protein n=1 Tax=Spongiimicrobium sp. 3-5 TaxID=3332596 RepID=UPI003980D4C0
MKKIFKQIKRQRATVVSLFFLFFLFTMCITITGVIQPSTTTVGEEISITVDINVNPSTDDTQFLVFGFLAPITWDVEGTGTVSYTSTVGDGTMSLISDSEIAPNSAGGLNWEDEIKTVLGIGENYGEVKWVVYKSDQTLTAQNGVAIVGQIQLGVTVGPDNLVTQLGYVVANTGYGVSGADHAVLFTDCMEVTGGSNPSFDLCGPVPDPVTFEPEIFSFEDIIKINFDATKGDTALLDVDQVYLCASAMVDGMPVAACDIDSALGMINMGSNLWSISIWPRGLFNVDDGSSISEITYTFRNEAGDIVVQDPNTVEDFILEQNCN